MAASERQPATAGIEDFVERTEQPAGLDRDAVLDIMHLAELVPLLRQRLAIDPAFSDDAMLASLKAIAVRSAERERWQAAFGSNLGRHIAVAHPDPTAALTTLVALLPRPRL
ncbi:MAG: hypothetical protein NW205_06225 [Hyphomicrobiaceae bacterium]|nr:hypothetical protein [Hyphomicrobiaceae bacterium]